jgi:amino acid adenylation domain-containing protein
MRLEPPRPPDTVVHRVYRQALLRPGGPAVIDGSGVTTYAALVTLAESLRTALDGQIAGERCAAVLCPRGSDFVAAALGIMAHGAAYLPIELGQPPDRVLSMIEDSGAAVLVTVPNARLPAGIAVPTIEMDGRRNGAPADPRPLGAVEQGLAYVVYTSGTQGVPKGVEVQHDSLRNLIDWHVREYAVQPGERALHTASLSFDAAVWELWPYLSAGATVVVAPDEVRASPERILAFQRQEPSSRCFLPTPLAEEVLSSGADPGWQTLLTGGDRLRVGRSARAYTLVNHYGPTEATVVTTRFEIGREAYETCAPIGQPIAGTQVRLLDQRGDPAGPGEAGEIVIGGGQVARGYRNRPDLTAERFIAVPGRPGRWYRTGDLGRWREDGELEFLGRVDQEQLKVRGVRVEASEIEAALLRCPGVRNVAVALAGHGRKEMLVAVMSVEHTPPTPRELRAALADRLPLNLVPSRVVVVDQLPVTINGKIDRRTVSEVVAHAVTEPPG